MTLYYQLVLYFSLIAPWQCLLAQGEDTSERDQTTLEMSNLAPENEAQLAEAVKWINDDLDRARAANPGLKIELIKAKPEESVAEEPTSDAPTPPTKTPSKNYVAVFSVVRAIINGGITTWTLISQGDVPVLPAALMGATVSAMAYGLQTKNISLQKWYVKDGSLSRWYKKRKTEGSVVLGKLEEFSRWYVVDLSYIGVSKLAMLTLNIALPATATGHLLEVFGLAAVGLVAQAPWEIGFSRTLALDSAKEPEKAKKHHLYSDLKVLSVSALVVLGQSLVLLQVPHAHEALLTLSGVGIFYYLKTLYKERVANRGQATLAAGPACGKTFAP